METNYMVGFFWKDKVENQLTPEELHKWEIERAYREGFYAGAAEAFHATHSYVPGASLTDEQFESWALSHLFRWMDEVADPIEWKNRTRGREHPRPLCVMTTEQKARALSWGSLRQWLARWAA